MVQGDVRVSATDPASNYVGVTQINGRLTVPTTQDVLSFTCLEVVDGNVEIGGLSGLRGSLANAFPNLRSTGQVDISGFSDTVTIDACAFRSLVRAGAYFQSIGELSGQLDLSPLREFAHIRIRNSLLRRLTLPSNGSFSIGQLQIAGNTMLTTVAGFENVTLIAPAPNGFFSLDITENPMLPSCRAEQLHQMFLAAGYVADQLFVSDNGPPCP